MMFLLSRNWMFLISYYAIDERRCYCFYHFIGFIDILEKCNLTLFGVFICIFSFATGFFGAKPRPVRVCPCRPRAPRRD
ncbi:hypothetical protein A7X67_03370 [Clostridium sp. W14A]|nr:hypothetical protein A7X67_03370 [Clostridium sp. W14A]